MWVMIRFASHDVHAFVIVFFRNLFGTLVLVPMMLRNIARPRQVAMYLAKKLTPRSLPEIGRRFGGRDHTTVMHAVKRIEELRAADSELNNDVVHLTRLLDA